MVFQVLLDIAYGVHIVDLVGPLGLAVDGGSGLTGDATQHHVMGKFVFQTGPIDDL